MLKHYETDGLKYLLSCPDSLEADKKYPLIVFLHGAGTISDTTDKLEKNSVFLKLCSRQSERGYVVLAPLCHVNNWLAHMQSLINIVDNARNFIRGDHYENYPYRQI